MENLKNSIAENALLIAKFEGYETFHENGYWQIQYTEDNERTVIDTAYHNSWDWLMPVVEKIESFTNEQNHCKYNVLIEQCFVEIIENHTSHTIVEVDKDTKLEAIYIAVVEFIKWYNQQKLGE